MKKIFVAALALLTVTGVSAQKSAVKEAKSKAEALSPDFAAARSIIAPAFTNDETKDDANTYYVAGKIEFDYFGNMEGKRMIGENVDQGAMGKALLSGFEYMQKALLLDTVPQFNKDGSPKMDKKTGAQKIEAKHSKDILKQMGAYYPSLQNAGAFLYNSQNYQDAYKVWNLFTTLPTDPKFDKLIEAPADSTIAEVAYNMGIVAWQAQDNPSAILAFEKAISMGYDSKEPLVYDYAISIASSLQDENKVLALANEANAKFGATTEKYISIIINDKINKEQYAEAMNLLNKAIEIAPNNAELYNLLGILYQSQKEFDKARTTLERAYSLNPESAQINFNLGRAIYAQGAAIDEANTNLPTAEYNKLRAEKIDPILKEAIPYLEFALKDDKTFDESKRLLRSLYYTINDDANLERIEKM